MPAKKPRSASSAPPAIPVRNWCGCSCGIRASRSSLLTADRRAGQAMRDVFAQFAPYALPRAHLDRGRGLEDARPRSRLLRAAARRDAEGHQGSAREGAAHQGRRSVGRLPARRSRRLCALVRPRASRAGTAEGGGVRPHRSATGARSRRRGSSPIRAATRAARSSRSFRCSRPRPSIPTRSSSMPSPA